MQVGWTVGRPTCLSFLSKCWVLGSFGDGDSVDSRMCILETRSSDDDSAKLQCLGTMCPNGPKVKK